MRHRQPGELHALGVNSTRGERGLLFREFAGGIPFGGGTGTPFGPSSFGGGRVRVYGCTPGCIITSIVVSIVLSVLLTLLLNLIF